jgi:hypothetical protein
MAESDFQVVFDGQLIEGANLDQVKAKIATLFKTEVAKVEPLFLGGRSVVKRGLDEATAEKYRVAFEHAGAVAVIVNPNESVSPATGPAPVAPKPEDSPPTSAVDSEDEGPSRLEIAEASRAAPPLVARGLPSAPEDMTMADPGAMLVDGPSTVEAPDIDTSHLILSEPGVDLVEHEKSTAPEYDLSAFELAPPGTTLGDDT